MANYRLSEEAKHDLLRIHAYGVLKFGATQADRYINTFFDYFEIISKSPFSFQAVDYVRAGYRRCVCGSDSIFYRIENGVVEIVAIVGQQDLNKIF